MFRASLGIRARILLLIALPFAVMLGLTIYQALGERDSRLATARTHILNTARIMAGQQQQSIASVHQIMLSAALVPEVNRGVASEACNRALAAILKQETALAAIALADPHGDVICNATPTAQRVNIVDRDHFKGAIQTRKFAVGGYVISRSTGKPSLGFGLPLLDEAGAPRAVIAVSLSLAWLQKGFVDVQLPAGSRVSLIDSKGLVLGRYPDPEGAVGKPLRNLPMLKGVIGNDGDEIMEDIGDDGLKRIFGFVRLSPTISGQTYLWVSVPRQVYLSPLNRAFFVTLLGQLMLLVLTFLVFWFGSEWLFLRRITALAEAESELGKGNLGVRIRSRAPRDEIGQLEQSFDRMSESIQSKVAGLAQSEERFRSLIEQSMTGIYIHQDGVFRYANPRFEQMLGYGAGEMIGLRPADLVVAEDVPLMLVEWEKLRAGAISSSYEVRMRRKDASVTQLGVQGRLYQLDGKPATIGMAQDITEKKRAEAQIQDQLRQLESAFMSSVKVATTLSELRDPYTAGHERRVGKLAAAIGAELGLGARAQEGLLVAGYLHDVGKITIPSEILCKPTKLGAIELELIQSHAQASYDVLKNVEFPWPVAQAALQHHERMDGSGYPQGLKGEAILLEARILAVADVVEAMSSNRPYRAGLGIEKALMEIERGCGSAYDPAVAQACLNLFRKKGYTIPD